MGREGLLGLLTGHIVIGWVPQDIEPDSRKAAASPILEATRCEDSLMPSLRVILLWHQHQPFYKDLVTLKVIA
jgi:hypothetical protein